MFGLAFDFVIHLHDLFSLEFYMFIYVSPPIVIIVKAEKIYKI